MAKAIGAFERGLLTPTRFDKFLVGDDKALNELELAGLTEFLDAGCGTCHTGPYVGGAMYQKLGLENPWDDDEDQGRFVITAKEFDRQVFKVPSLRNVAKTEPYFHTGLVESLDEAVRLMADHQLDISLTDVQVTSIVAFLNSLTGDIDLAYIKRPELPESSEATPSPLATPTLTPRPDTTPEPVATAT
jgi:cytochrome c peroxidase